MLFVTEMEVKDQILHLTTEIIAVQVVEMNDLELRILSLNGSEVSLLEKKNDVREAMFVFHNCVQMIQMYARHYAISLTDRSSITDQLILTQSLHQLSSDDVDIVGPYCFGSCKIDGMQNELFYVFDRPLFVHNVKMDNGIDSNNNDRIRDESSICNITMAVLFNFSLACHKQAIQFGSSHSYQCAIHMYLLTISTIMTAMPNRFDRGTIMCLIINNLASIDHEIGDYHLCAIELNIVNEIMIQDKSMETYAAQIIGSKELRDIQLNYIFGQCPHASRAA